MIVILGSEGLMGLEITTRCKERNIDYIAFNHSNGDITDYKRIEEIINETRPDIIINCVGIVGVSLCESNRDNAISVNSDSVLNLSKLCHKYDITLLQLSTIGIFGDKGYFSKENDEPHSDTLYTSTKLLAEMYVKNNCHRYYIVRLPFVFGKLESGGTLGNLLLKIKNGETVTGDINAIYRFGYSKDMSECIMDIITNGYPYGMYHIYNEGYASIFDFLCLGKEITKSNAAIKLRIKEKESFTCSLNTKHSIKTRHFKDAMVEAYG